MDKPKHIVLTSHPGREEQRGPKIQWGDADPKTRGPVIGSVQTPAKRNVIGTHSGSYSIYRALAVASGQLDADHVPDLTDTTPIVPLGPHPQWSDPDKIVSLDPFGHLVGEAFAEELKSGLDIRPTIAVTRARLHLPEFQMAVKEGRLKPDGKFLMSSMQENQLHGWRVADEKNMRMGGYPAKVKSLVFMSKGQFLATSGAQGVVIWPFGGSTGPMGKQAAEVGFDASTLVSRVAAPPTGQRVAAGLEDDRVWVCDLAGQKIEMLKAEKGPPITALSITPDGKRVAWGDEDGAAGVAEAP